MQRLKWLFISLATFLPTLISAQAPNFVVEFSNCFGGSLEEDYFAGSRALDGGYLMSGYANSIDGDIDSTLAYDTTNIFVVKCDQFGNKVWAKTFGGNDYDKARYIMQDADSNYLITGVTHSSDGDIDTTHGDSELFIIKLDSNGDKIWMKQYGGTAYEGGRHIQQLADGNYLVTGYSTSQNGDVPMTRGQHDGWLMKMDVNGNIIWSQTYGGSGDDRLRITIPTPDSGFMFLGSSTSNDFQVSGNHGGEDFWVGKVDSAGNLLWNYSYGGSGEDWPYHLSAASDGNYFLTGTTYSSDGDVSGFYGNSDGWVVKIDPNGLLLWQKCYGGSLVDRLYRTFDNGSGKLTIFGFSQSTDGSLTGSNNFGPSNNYWLAQLDSVNETAWNYCIGGALGDFGIDLFIDTVNNSYTMMGESSSPNSPVMNLHGNWDFWIVKITITTGLNDLSSAMESNVPFYDYSSSSLVIRSTIEEDMMLGIYDITGRSVSSEKVHILPGENHFRLHLSTGTYMARFDDGKPMQPVKFAVVQ